MAKPPGLRQRGNSWEMRVRVPQKRQGVLPTERVKSFGAISFKDACRLGWDARVNIEREFEEAELTLGLAAKRLLLPIAPKFTEAELLDAARRYLSVEFCHGPQEYKAFDFGQAALGGPNAWNTFVGAAGVTGTSEQRAAPSWYRRLRLRVAIALLILAGGAMLYTFSVIGGGRPAKRVSLTKLNSSVGQIRTLTLPGGARVTLDSDTIIETAANEGMRSIHLEHGRARFEVSRPSRPLTVAAGGGSIITHGGTFDVAQTVDTISVAVLRGVVEVHKYHLGQTEVAGHILSAGQAQTLSGNGAASAPHSFDAAKATWTLRAHSQPAS